ncbi:unnamed protein product [Polarella glacialis]|uniref:Uncharacterized protein n=1 Tax=Polarella glacialis TaxID=89957 RepID=A0A813J4S2_POLGL|nr:unnamed protein product [Polarella glacialis]
MGFPVFHVCGTAPNSEVSSAAAAVVAANENGIAAARAAAVAATEDLAAATAVVAEATEREVATARAAATTAAESFAFATVAAATSTEREMAAEAALVVAKSSVTKSHICGQASGQLRSTLIIQLKYTFNCCPHGNGMQLSLRGPAHHPRIKVSEHGWQTSTWWRSLMRTSRGEAVSCAAWFLRRSPTTHRARFFSGFASQTRDCSGASVKFPTPTSAQAFAFRRCVGSPASFEWHCYFKSKDSRSKACHAIAIFPPGVSSTNVNVPTPGL